MRNSLIVACCGALALPGCAGFRGATNTLDPGGPTSTAPSYAAVITPKSPGSAGLFEVSYTAALSDQIAISQGKAAAAAHPTDAVSIRARQMAVDGMNLVDDYCAVFFRTAGDNQKWLNVGKDLIAVVGTTATGVLALASPANAAASGAVALATGTAYNGVDLYTRNFLFGADNIESVRTLVISALVEHRVKVLPSPDTSIWSFGGASQAINEHQDICTSASIRSLVLAAIKGGTVTGYSAAGKIFAVQAGQAAAAAAPAAADAATTAAGGQPAAAAAQAAASAGASAGATAAAIAKAVPGATPASVVSASASAVQSGSYAAALANGVSASTAQRISAAVSSVVVPAIAGVAAAPSASPASRHVTLEVNGQAAGP